MKFNFKILVTGSAGFIGSFVCLRLLEKNNDVVGIDNHNNYYDPKIKDARLDKLRKFSNYKHYKIDISNKHELKKFLKIKNQK